MRIRYEKNKWLKFLIEKFEVIGDKGYRGCELVKVCEDKSKKGTRQAVESVNSQIRVFRTISRCGEGITLLAYFYTYAIGYSFFRKGLLWS